MDPRSESASAIPAALARLIVPAKTSHSARFGRIDARMLTEGMRTNRARFNADTALTFVGSLPIQSILWRSDDIMQEGSPKGLR